MIDPMDSPIMDPGIDASYGGQGRSAFPICTAYAQGTVPSRKTTLPPVPGAGIAGAGWLACAAGAGPGAGWPGLE